MGGIRALPRASVTAIALMQGEDGVTIDMQTGELSMQVSEEKLAKRREA